MDTPPPVEVEERALRSSLVRSWGLQCPVLRYIPKGAGSYHWAAATSPGQRYFVTVDDLHAKPWLGSEPDVVFAGLSAAYATAWMLSDRAHLGFVVPPIPDVHGNVTRRLVDRYSLTVFPYVSGRSGRWGVPISRPARDRLLCRLAELHLATPAVADRAPRYQTAIQGRDRLEAALGELDGPWTERKLSEAARRELSAHAGELRESLTRFDDLAAQVATAAAQPVITHGELHPGNLMLRNGGLLVDWDTVALAPPERDLWMLDDGRPRSLASYTDMTGAAVDYSAICLFRLAWTLSDLADLVHLLRSENDASPTFESALAALGELLRTGASRPYGPPPASGK